MQSHLYGSILHKFFVGMDLALHSFKMTVFYTYIMYNLVQYFCNYMSKGLKHTNKTLCFFRKINVNNLVDIDDGVFATLASIRKLL